MDPAPFVILLTTFPADEDASALARALVTERLAACVNVLPPMASTYRWEDNVEVVSEHQLVIKTMATRVEPLKTRLNELHPYNVPEVLVLPVSDGAATYLEWVRQSVE
jgi:periplasmic divalent cation tolerance protein